METKQSISTSFDQDPSADERLSGVCVCIPVILRF